MPLYISMYPLQFQNKSHATWSIPEEEVRPRALDQRGLLTRTKPEATSSPGQERAQPIFNPGTRSPGGPRVRRNATHAGRLGEPRRLQFERWRTPESTPSMFIPAAAAAGDTATAFITTVASPPVLLLPGSEPLEQPSPASSSPTPPPH